MDILKEFEAHGGFSFEEADDEVGVTYFDGQTKVIPTGKGAAVAGRKRVKTARTAKADREADADVDGAPEPVPEVADVEPAADEVGSGEPPALAGAAAATEAAPASADDGAADEAAVAVPPPAKEAEEEPDLPAWAQFELHSSIVRGLARLRFVRPTEVQARCLIPAIRQRKDIVGAAETGSGKTLAFGLPMLHHTLIGLGAEATSSAPAASSGSAPGPGRPPSEGALRGLVVLPTRELAVQVQGHINAVAEGTPVRAECVVGGMSLQKQRRLLGRKPAIVVGTPGRLHALLGLGREAMEERCDWLRESLRDLRHLVLDEADRLVESGHFKELDTILALVYSSVLRPQQLQTFVFSATLTLDPRSDWLRKKHGDEGGKVGALMRRLRFREPRAVHTVDLTQPEDAAAATSSKDGGAGAGPAREPEARRSGGRLPERLRLMEAVCSDDKDREAVLAMWLLRRFRWDAAAGGPAAAVAAATSSTSRPTAQRPDRRQSAADAAPVSTGGRVVLFVNAISSVLRLSSVLSLLLESPSASKVLNRVKMAAKGKGESHPGLTVDVLGLHSRMKQKDRLRRMERFRSLQHAVLVCTDIAARGLDVPEVTAVLHYQAPRSVEVFVHRSGRTARAGRSGESVAFMGPGDASQWTKVYRAAGVAKEQVADVGVVAFELNAAKEAVRLAADLEGKVHRLHKRTGDRTWLRRAAEEADLAISDDEGDRDQGAAAAPRRQLWGLYQQLQARVRRPPRRAGAGPMPRSQRRRR